MHTKAKVTVWLVAITCAIVIGVTGSYLASLRENRTIDQSLRDAWGGSYVELSDGVTHYELAGPVDGPVVVLVHGGTNPMFTWEPQFASLVGAGFRVLRYDQFGRGYSDRPGIEYDRAFYMKQLRELLDVLDIGKPVRLVGVSFGAAVSTNFAASYPQEVVRLVLISPAYHYSAGRLLFKITRVPGMGEWFVRVFGVPTAIKRAKAMLALSKTGDGWARRFVEQTQYVGFEESLLSMTRSDALESYSDAYHRARNIPTLLIWGANDDEIPVGHVHRIRDQLTQGEYIELKGVGHGALYEAPERISRESVRFLK